MRMFAASRFTLLRVAMLVAVTFGFAATAQTLPAVGDVTVEGRVAETFGVSFVMETESERLLVTLRATTQRPPLVGERVRVTGSRDASTLAARTVEVILADAPGADAERESDDAHLPPLLQGLGLRDVWRYDEDDGEVSITAVLPDGSWLALSIEREDGAEMLEIEAAEGLPRALLERVAPPTLLSADVVRNATAVVALERDEDTLELEVLDASGWRIEVEATLSGRILEVERSGDEHRDEVRIGHAEVEATLTAWGYRDVHDVEGNGRHVEARAVNPYGEPVLLEIDAKGRITRERILWDEVD